MSRVSILNRTCTAVIRAFVAWWIVLHLTSVLVAQPANKESQFVDFRVDTDIYKDVSQKPISKIQTIFSNGQFIEINESSKRYTVIDPAKNRISLLDAINKRQLQLEMSEVEKKLDTLINLLTPNQHALAFSNGKVQEQPGGGFSLGNDSLTYYFKPMSTTPTIAKSYGEYANWAVRINWLHAQKQPPQLIRMELNDLLMSQSQIPDETRRVQQSKDGSAEVTAKIILTNSLNDNDRKQIASIIQWMQSFKLTSEDVFFN